MENMLKTTKYKYISPAYTRIAVLLALIFCVGAQGLRAQGYFTLTNGHYYWFDGQESDSDNGKYLTGYDQANGWVKIHNRGTHATATTTEIVAQGDTYLALDTSDAANPSLTSLSTAGGFDPLCVWFRTGNTGNYYQEWNGYRYYLIASHSEGLSVYKVAVDAPLQKRTTWYNWDHGCAITEQVAVPGGTKESYYWMIYDTLNDADGTPATPVWRMSEVSCYQRPNEIIYNNYHADGAGGNTWDGKGNGTDDGISYYDNVSVGGVQNYPAGAATTFMEVKKIEHPKTIIGGHGLDSLTVYEDGNLDPNLEGYTFAYGSPNITVHPIINTMVQMESTPAYTEYVEEYYRRGINLNSASRTTEGFNKAGVPSVRKWYYYPDTNVIGGNGDITRYDVLPHSVTEWTSAADWEYTLDSRAKRFLEILPGTGNTCYLHFKDRPLTNTDAYLTCTVTYYNGTSESITDTIHITVSDHVVTPVSKHAPVVKGSLFGGGRMANVRGNTSIIVHNTDSIYALYGGNDIAGWVQGDEGSTIQIGTRHTNADHPVHIGWVYGGGCGFYTYQGINVAMDDTGATVDPYVYNNDQSSLMHSAYFFNGKVYKWNTVPSDYDLHADTVIERYNAVAADEAAGHAHSYTDADIMAPYYRAAWNDDDLVVDQTFSYIPYYYCDNEGNTHITFDENAETVDNTENGNGTACMASKDYMGLVPYIKTSHISVGVPEVDGHNDDYGHNAHEHNDYILIDSLFGGAENAFIGVTSTSGDYASAITVDVNGGTILALFGGNNYGGSIAKTAMTLVNIHCTKLTDDESMVENTYFGGMGRTQGIRHVFGGGNKVESPHAQLSFYGGMVDTAFIGGNMASVKNPVGIVNCQHDGTGYGIDGSSGGTFQNGHFIYTNPTLTDTTFADLRDITKNKNYVPDNGLYNVHFLFGGNNNADMDNVSFIQLLSGGVGAVLGGGNKGDMTNDQTLAEAAASHSGYIDIRPLLSTMDSILSRSTLISTPNKVGAVVAALQRSRIIVDYVHGGCRQSNIKNSCGVYLAGGSYHHVFAGNDVSGDVGSEHDGATYAVITGDAVVHANVYGGNDGYYHCEARDSVGAFNGHYADDKLTMEAFNSDVDYDPYGEMVGRLLPTQQHANVFVNGGIIKGNLVAGGDMANIGYANVKRNPTIQYNWKSKEDTMDVGKNKGTVCLEIADTAKIYGNVFGGGANASVYGLSQIYVHGTPVIHGSLFAGNDCVGKVESFLPYRGNLEDPHQDLSYFKYYYDHLYAGGATIATTHNDSVAYMDAHMTQHERLLVESLNQASQLSSNGDSLNVYTTTVDGIKQYDPRYDTYVLIEDSPIINSVYGSGNGAWDYDGTRPQFPSTYVCAGTEGNRPDQKSTYIDIHTSGGFIDTVFGGGAGCTVAEDVVVLLNNTGTANTSYPGTSELRALGMKGGTPVSNGSNNSDNFVGTIFGGNNFSDMKTVPDIRLVKGNVKNVYGGGNAGNMTGLATLYDICGKEVKNVSTHVLSASDQVTVTDSVFGGCRTSDIDGMAYVDIRKTSNGGINYIYGGNDVSGNVKGNTRIDLSGGLVQRIWGGSNGRYDFVPVGNEEYNVYNFGKYDAEHPDDGLITTAGRPHVDSSNVNLWGGTVNASVFTGSSMTDCRATCLIVDDQIGCTADGISTGNVVVNGTLFGGGEGRWDDLNKRDLEGKRWGNITGSTHVHLHHAKDVSAATAYGGGGGGDVQNTFIKTYDTWETPFDKIFGGCWGADVYGTAHLEFNGVELTRYLFGGNDFTGNVYRSEIVVNSGRFFNVFGGGNGDYPDSYYSSQYNYAQVLGPTGPYAYMHARENAYAGNKHIERPNTEYVHITFNDGEVDSCLYGGGKMGTILPYKKDPTTSEYIYNLVDTNNVPTATTEDDLQRFIPDTMRVAINSQYDANHTELTVSDPTDLSYVVVNIHGGKFHRNAFAGGRGFKNNKKPIVYGLKVMNMDGGEIYESLYGGSEFVNDGYPAECKAPSGTNPTRQQRLAVTTMRPSSILNITGGTVGSNLYGTGYQGIVYGSSYVNIGVDAIDSCTVWRNSYGNDSEDSTYIMFKPGQAGGQSDALVTNTLTLRNSVYSGANWGNASGAVTFNNPGFVGGESRMYIDGNGYNTTNDLVSTNPEMVIMRSLYGSGTSVLGGDIHSHVEVRNYGGMESCHPTKTIETIQRTDSLWLHNTAIIFKGTTDASQQYMSNRYSLKNIGYLNYRGYNVSELEAGASEVENLAFYEQGSTATRHSGEKFDTVVVPLVDLNSQVRNNDHASCGDNVDICSKEYMVSPTVENKRHTLLILDNGVNLSIDKKEGSTTTYGSVTGYGHVVTPGGYQSTITARPKMRLASYSSLGGDSTLVNAQDGGFVTNCDTSNRKRTLSASLSDVNPAWSTRTAEYSTADELKYTNHAVAIASGFYGDPKYREWKAGDKQGMREVEATLLAHSNPAKLKQDWSMEITAGTTPNTELHKFGIAEAMFEMPATTAGHYYQLIGEGFTMTGSNGEIVLVDSAWAPLMTAAMGTPGANRNMAQALGNINNWYTSGHRDPDVYGQWRNIYNGDEDEMEGSKEIRKNPEYTFGLIMIPNNNFATIGTNTPTTETGWHSINGNYFYYMGGNPDLDTNGSDVTMWDGLDYIEVDLTTTRNFIVKECDPDEDEDLGTYWWQDGTATSLQSYNMNLTEGQTGYDATLHSRFTALGYSCGDYSYETYGTYSQDHWSYTYDMPAFIDSDQDGEIDDEPDQDWANFIINGNARVNSVNHYCSPKVYDANDANNPELKPSMRLYLTYDTTFTTTFNGTVTFQMMEYDASGNEVAPIQVKVYIQTIIDSLKSIEQDVLAMYNGGRTNTFTRKVELVPCGEERNLYITGIRWMPTESSGEDTTTAAMSSNFGNSDRFSLLPEPSQVTAISDDYPHSVAAGHFSGSGNHNSHNRFAMTIIPTNNVSEDAGMANGWIRGVGDSTNLYKLAYPSGTNPVKTCTWDAVGDSVAIRPPQNVSDAHGYFLGTLDGRGSAMIDVELSFDGTRTYDDINGNGYVGKVILSMETFTEEGDESRGTFDVTIYVKTRSHGDTIYMASADSVKRCVASNKCITLYPYSNTTHHTEGSYQKSDIGKTPGMYVKTFRKALEDGIYQEGDVLCIIDTVKITNPVHITGPNGPAIQVIRYEGHHHELPDEQSVYRGPMIVVSNGTSFTAENIAFHGSASAKIKHIKRQGDEGSYNPEHINNNAALDGTNLQFYTYIYGTKTIDKLPDTNIAYAPIIQATGAGTTVNLREGTMVQHNWNGYGSVNLTDGTAGDQVVDATGMPTDASYMGAINVTNGATLTLGGNINVTHNFSHTMTGLDNLAEHDSISVQKAPGGAAIYVDGGKVELPESNRNTAITITDNYLMDPAIHDPNPTLSWWETITVDGVPERYAIDEEALSTWHPANVLLTREAPTTGTYYEKTMNDTQSDVIVISGTVGDSTKIGVRKWFPGIHERDTIRFVTVTGGNNSILAIAVRDNENFLSDDGFRTFYNPLVNLTTGYFFRCATFRHQLASDTYIGPVYNGYGLQLAANDVLSFGVKDILCPMDGDSIIYRVQGGLMPYTYTWSDPTKSVTLQKTVTPYSDAQVQYDLKNTSLTAAERYAKYAASIADTLLLPNETLAIGQNNKWNHLLVTATDATGECQLYKNIDLRIYMDHETTDPLTYWPKATAAADTSSHRDNNTPWMTDTVGSGWTDTARTVHAIASRNFKGVKITPMVYVDAEWGTIAASALTEDGYHVYRFVNEDSSAFNDLLFCEGDQLFLKTSASGSGNTNRFIMWSFNPYTANPATFVVPGHDETVVAYYGPNDYWKDVISSEALAGAELYEGYYYNGRTNPSSGYVTTYNGDVHIYDENGLAWLISVVNGLNGTQARPMRFNRVYLHQKDAQGTPYDMKDHLWTPVGNLLYGFRGDLVCVGPSDTATMPLPEGQYVTVKHIILNEPNVDKVAFFALLDQARVRGLNLQNIFVRGGQYVSAMAASSTHSTLQGVGIDTRSEDLNNDGVVDAKTSILSTHYAVGGLVAESEGSRIDSTNVAHLKLVGNAVYVGGALARGDEDSVLNSSFIIINEVNSNVGGGVGGQTDGTAPSGFFGRLFGRKSAGRSYIANNYVHVRNDGKVQSMGGLVGRSSNTVLENNYVYGDISATGYAGALAADMEDYTSADKNYYAEGSVEGPVGMAIGNVSLTDASSFSGSGNQVMLANPVYNGVDNLTLALNKWVREQNAAGAHFKTWRSDLDNVNNGYPVFGTPDMIPVVTNRLVEGCDEVVVDGILYSYDTVVSSHSVDYNEMVDSTVTTTIRLHATQYTALSDTATYGNDYEGHGFTITADELHMLGITLGDADSVSIILHDTLTTAFGCDSIVTLTLTFYASQDDIPQVIESVTTINVYPNPTTGVVTIDAEEMSHVEIYDNEGRRLQDYDAHNRNTLTIDISPYASGIYFVRIHTPHGVTIQKLIKR